MKTKCLLLLTLICLGISLGVQSDTASQLETLCEKGDPGDMYCVGYTNGVLAGYMLASPSNQRVTCVPDGAVTRDQIRRIAMKYIELNPDLLAKDAGVAIIGAMAKAFPCKH